MSEQQYETISCLYKLLDLNETGVWDSDGTFYLNRPFSTSTLSKLKYRSFSTNIKSSLQNVQTPTLNCSLCANVEILNTTSTAPENITTTDELKNKPKLLTTGNINNEGGYSLNILNQTGLKSYNNLIGTNTIKISDFNIPLNNNIQESITSGLNLAKIELLKTLGLSINESEDQGNFDYMSFQYGDYRYKLNDFPSLSPMNSLLFVNYNQSPTIQIIPKTMDTWTQVNIDTSNNTASTKISVPTDSYGINASSSSDYSAALMITNEDILSDPHHFYHLPDTWGYYSMFNYGLTKRIDLTQNAEYLKFVNKANYGIVLSCTSGYNGGLFVAIAANDIIDKPCFCCASLQRMLYNQDEFKMYRCGDTDLIDLTQHLNTYLPLIESYGCPTTAYFLKFDIKNVYKNHVNIFYFMDNRNGVKTFYAYMFTTTNSEDVDSNGIIIKNRTLTNKLIMPFTDNTDFMIDGSNYKKWNAMIDTYYSPFGALPVNFGNVRGLFGVDNNNNIKWLPFDTLLTDKQGLISVNIFHNSFSNIGCVMSKVIYNSSGDNNIICNYLIQSQPEYLADSTQYKPVPYDTIQSMLKNYTQNNDNPLVYPNYFTMYKSITSSKQILFSIVADSNMKSYWYPGEVSTPSTGIRYTLANSMLSVNTWNGTFTAYLPHIDEYGTTTAYNWINQKHITPETAENYQYIYYNCNTDKASAYNEFINSIFKWDTTANTITFPVVPLYKTDTNTTYANLIFYITFTTSPNVIQFDPNIKQGIRSSCATYYSVYNQLINKQPSLYIQTYKFNDYFIILDEDYYNRINVYLGLITTDLTLNFISPEFPTINNCVFQLNESSLVDFKESKPIPSLARVSGRLIDAGGSVLLKEDAQKLYSNITICIDWEFAK